MQPCGRALACMHEVLGSILGTTKKNGLKMDGKNDHLEAATGV